MSTAPSALRRLGPTARPLTGGPAVAPRRLPAYRDMFLLDDDELLGGPILDCPGGASPFAAQVRARGGDVVTVGVERPLTALPFRARTFALALSAFRLFAHPDLLDAEQHLTALLELARVTTGEVRVFPLHDSSGVRSAALPQLRERLLERGVTSQLRPAGCRTSPLPGNDRMLVCQRLRSARP